MKVKMIFSLIIFAITIGVYHVCYAAVEIVPSKNGKGTDQIVNTTISNSFLLCRGMKNVGESLNGTNVDPHLATNKDWGAVSYLSNSIYGTNTEGKNRGIEVTIDNVKYYSTTPNITGVMNWGSNPNVSRSTQTSGLISNYNPETSTASEYVVELYNNRDTEYVDYVDATINTETLGMAINETNGMYNVHFDTNQKNNNTPISLRTGLLSGTFGFNRFGHGNESGKALSHVTFRPVIWN